MVFLVKLFVFNDTSEWQEKEPMIG